MLSASNGDNKIAWYENTGGGRFTPHTITTDAKGAHSVAAADLDGDGDIDVLSASFIDNKIAWYENDGGGQAIAEQQQRHPSDSETNPETRQTTPNFTETAAISYLKSIGLIRTNVFEFSLIDDWEYRAAIELQKSTKDIESVIKNRYKVAQTVSRYKEATQRAETIAKSLTEQLKLLGASTAIRKDILSGETSIFSQAKYSNWARKIARSELTRIDVMQKKVLEKTPGRCRQSNKIKKNENIL